jgi:hypothetical protein
MAPAEPEGAVTDDTPAVGTTIVTDTLAVTAGVGDTDSPVPP